MQVFEIVLVGDIRKKVQGYTKYSGLLGIHQQADDPGVPFEANWTVTHIPSGRAFGHVATKTGANQLAKTIHDRICDEKAARSSDPAAVIDGFGSDLPFAIRQITKRQKPKLKKTSEKLGLRPVASPKTT